MKQKLFTFLIAFLATMSGAVWGQQTEQSTPIDISGGTVNLDNVKVNVSSGYALEVTSNVTLNITGVCEITSGGGANPAVLLPEGQTLTITGTGILRIKGNEGVQTIKGESNGNSEKTGNIIVQSGTVYFLGDIGHDNSGKHGMIQTTGGIAFVDGEIKGDDKVDNKGGILFQRDNSGWSGTLYDDYVINSNIQADIDGDGQADDDPITLNLNNHDLSLDNGVVIDNRTGNFTVTGEGSFKCFTVEYYNNPVQDGDNTSTAPTNESYYGTSADIWLEKGVECNGKTASGIHEFLGWVERGKTEVHAAANDQGYQGSIKTPSSYDAGQTQPKTINIDAAWAAKERTINLSEEEAMNPSVVLADKPDNTVTYKAVTTGWPNGISFAERTGTISGTPESGTATGGTSSDGKYTISVPYTYTLDGESKEGTATIYINVESTKPNISSATIELTAGTEYTYDGEIKNPIQLKIGDIPYNHTFFTVEYDYTPEEEEAGTTSQVDGNTVVKNAGTYKITKITAKGNAEGEITSPKIDGQDITITVKQRALNFRVINQNIELDGGSANTTASLYRTYNTTGTIQLETGEGKLGFVQGEVTQNSYDIFTGSLTTTYASGSGVGTYDIDASSVQLQNNSASTFLKNNYTATITKGTLTVTDALSDDDVKTEIENGDGEGDEDKPSYDDETNTWTLTYDGKTHEITKVKKGEVEILATGTNGEANYTISYTYKATEEAIEEIEVDLNNGGEVKNAGIYTATITFANGYEGTKTETIIIKPRALTVDLNIPETIDPEQDLDNLSSWWDKDDITLTGIVESEKTNAVAKLENASVSITGPLTAGEAVDVVVNNVKLEDNAPFLVSNYKITYQNGETNITTFETKDETGTENDATLDDGTTVGQIEINPSEGGDDITGGEDNTDPTDDDLEDDEDFVMIHPDGEGEISVYDGEPHGLSLLIIKKDGIEEPYILKETTDYTVTYEPQDDTKAVDTETGKPIHAGSYTATVTLVEGSQYKIKDSEDNSFTLTVQIAQRPMTVNLNIPTTIKSGQDLTDLSGWWSNEDITFENIVADEEDNARATLSNAKAHITGPLPAAGQKVTVTATDVKLTTDNAPFFVDNYEITYKNGEATLTLTDTDSDSDDDDASIDDGTTVDDSDKIEIDPDDDGTEITGGEDEDGDEDLDKDDYIMVSTGNSDDVNAIYDGETHTIEDMVVTVDGTTYHLTVGTDFTVGFNNGEEGLEEGKPHDAGTYTATIEMMGEYKGEFTLEVTISPRPLEVNVNLPKFIAPDQDLSNLSSWWNPSSIQLSGILQDEESAAREMLEDAEAIIESLPQSGAVNVTVKNIKLEDNDPFFTKNYTITYKNGQSTTLDDSKFTDKDNDGNNNDTDIDGGTTVIDPDYDGDYTDYIDYCNIYEDQICEGVTVEFSRDVVREGQSVLVTVKVDEEFDVTKMTLKFKRALFGYWEDLTLTPTENPGEYIIKNIYTDIYVRIEGAVPTGIESIDGAKVYTKDGSLFVQTPQQEQVRIISMTGAIVKNETQIGLRQYTGLNRGIYVVCVGDERFKVRL